MKKIILTGYMASGKTTIARLLAKAAGLRFVDLDEYIEKREGKTVPELFEQDGELKFRRLEHEALKELVGQEESFIIALGGGTPCYANNHEYFKKEYVISIYLKTSINELAKRIAAQETVRPLTENLKEGELTEFIAKHLFDRSYFYMQAKHIIATDGKKPEEVVNEIMSLF